MLDRLTPPAQKHSYRIRLVWLSVLALVTLYTYWQLKRVEQGHLFALALPGERPPTMAEIQDAQVAAQTFLYPAIAAVLGMGIVIAFLIPRIRLPFVGRSRSGTAALTLFLFAAMADLATTLHFFHHQGVDHELHPGIRLFGYAYGLTIGPVAGKLLQTLGIISLSLVTGRFGTLLLMVVAVVYGLAAIYNLMQISS